MCFLRTSSTSPALSSAVASWGRIASRRRSQRSPSKPGCLAEVRGRRCACRPRRGRSRPRRLAEMRSSPRPPVEPRRAPPRRSRSARRGRARVRRGRRRTGRGPGRSGRRPAAGTRIHFSGDSAPPPRHPARRARRGREEHDRVRARARAALVVDAGLAFPRDEHLGVDLVLPDLTYLRERRGSIRAVVLTHAHEDHVGGLPYLLREVRGARGLGDAADARPGQVEARRARPAERGRAARDRPGGRAGRDRAVPARVRADGALGAGQRRGRDRDRRRARAAHERLEARPHAGRRLPHRRRASSPSSATAASTCCSATRRTPSGPGFTGSERLVGEAFRQIIPQRQGRVLVASFASNVHRMQQAIDVAVAVAAARSRSSAARCART